MSELAEDGRKEAWLMGVLFGLSLAFIFLFATGIWSAGYWEGVMSGFWVVTISLFSLLLVFDDEGEGEQ